MASNSELRARARQQLGGNLFGKTWLIALLVLLLNNVIVSATASFLSFILNIKDTVFSFVQGFLYGPLTFGVSLVFLQLVRGKPDINIGDLFKGFSAKFGEYLLLGLMQGIFISLWSLLFVIPGIVKSYSYSMAFYIKCDHPNLRWNDCITASRRLMDGHKGQLFCLDLSFLGWYLLGSLALGVGILWVVPYHKAAQANFYASLVRTNTCYVEILCQ
ncbi:MAG: DUF975 family protein [Faecousia sp.]